MTDVYVAIHITTTCDEHAVYVTRDSAELIELAWVLVDGTSLTETHRDRVLVKPVNTPITPLCTSMTGLTWEHVRSAGTFKEAIEALDRCVRERVLSLNKTFALVAFHAWDIRVQLPREARDKAVALPLYLQHARVFDLQKEYVKWQAHHPESSPYLSGSLSTICAALEVADLAREEGCRALATAVVVAGVTVALASRLTTAEDRASVLTAPYDAQADLDAFREEHSKILHLSNLPHDATQSELEGWFTQYGGRPIAFWTLKTPDQHKSTGSGFAVFATHDEAVEALAMNGRALNERAVEVQPSSARVLDRAHDVLTPFPASKNRPRPGDWACPSCGFSNFQRRTACFRCLFPAAAAATVQESAYGYGGTSAAPGAYSRGSSSVPFRAGDWKCANETCAYHNFAKNVCCLRCGSARVASASTGGAPASDSLLTSFQRQYPQGYQGYASTSTPHYSQGSNPHYTQNTKQNYPQGTKQSYPQGTKQGYTQGSNSHYSQGTKQGYPHDPKLNYSQGTNQIHPQGTKSIHPQGSGQSYGGNQYSHASYGSQYNAPQSYQGLSSTAPYHQSYQGQGTQLAYTPTAAEFLYGNHAEYTAKAGSVDMDGLSKGFSALPLGMAQRAAGPIGKPHAEQR